MPSDSAAPSLRPAVLRVGAWIVYPRLCRATRDGATIHLRSQVVDLLLVLARRPNAIVSKQEVTEALWPGVHVSGSALSRCMAELRQVFEDDVRAPWLIETVAKRGYRVIAPVAIEQDEPTEVGPPGSGAAPRVLEAVSDSASGSRLRPSPIPRWPRRRSLLALAAVGLVAAAVWLVIVWRRPVVALSERDTVVIADVTNTTGDAALDGAIRLALAIQLEQAPFLRIVSDERVRETMALMKKAPGARVSGATALEVCRREGGALLLTGSIARLGQRYAVGLEAIGCRHGETLTRVIEQVDRLDAVLEAVGRTASAVRARLGESRASLAAHDVPVTRATTASLEALQALGLGDVRRDEGRLEEALEQYRQAAAIDADFALAWARQGAVLMNTGRGLDAARAFARAHALVDRTSAPERYYITAHYHLTVTHDVPQALAALRTWKRLYPGSFVPSVNLASLQIVLFGGYAEALAELQDAERVGRLGALPAWNRMRALLALGRVAEARRALDDPGFHGTLEAASSLTRIEIAWLDGDAAAVRAATDRAASRLADTPYVLLRQRAVMALADGRFVEGRCLADEALMLAAAAHDAQEMTAIRLTIAEMEAAVGHRDRAIRAASTDLPAGVRRGSHLRAAMVLAMADDEAGARAALERASRMEAADPLTGPLWLRLATATVQSVSHPEQALETLRDLQPYERGAWGAGAPLALRARLLDRLGRRAEAIEASREFLRWRTAVATSPHAPVLRLMLARSLVGTGDLAAGREAYQAFLDAWRGADPELPMLRSARAEQAALGAGTPGPR